MTTSGSTLSTLGDRQVFPQDSDLSVPAQQDWSRFLRSVFEGRRGTLIFFAVVLILQSPLIFNPGYFSHDELQWLWRADTPSWSTIQWEGWFNFAPFQFRPLTFNLWQLLMHAFGYQPMLVHAATISIGLLNTWMLRVFIRRCGASVLHATIAALVFLVTPYVVYVHGWVGTIAELVCLALVLASLLWLTRAQADCGQAGRILDVIIIGAFTWLALLSKETAIVFPVLLLCAWPLRGRAIIPAIVASAVMVGVYLWLRLDTILYSPHDGGAYGWSPMNIPVRAFGFAVYPFVPRLFEVFSITNISSMRLLAGVICCAAFLAVVFSAGWRWLAILVIGFLACIGPTLILNSASNVYAYLASAFACGLIGLLYGRLKFPTRAALTILAGIVIVHGVQVGGVMRNVGRIQYHMYQSLDTLLPQADSSNPIRIKALAERDQFVLQRLVHAIPTYRGVPLSDRVIALPFSDKSVQPTHIMLRSGELVPFTQAPNPAGH